MEQVGPGQEATPSAASVMHSESLSVRWLSPRTQPELSLREPPLGSRSHFSFSSLSPAGPQNKVV